MSHLITKSLGSIVVVGQGLSVQNLWIRSLFGVFVFVCMCEATSSLEQSWPEYSSLIGRVVHVHMHENFYEEQIIRKTNLPLVISGINLPLVIFPETFYLKPNKPNVAH
uniref:Uncharacterized protein n=1 Tax=Micrurus corallinus TaxID=54390 RepID=A0A2D4EW80_MICCO